MSSSSNATWLSLLEEKRTKVIAVIGQGCGNSPGYVSPNDGLAFRSTFERLCKEKREKRVSRLEAKLLPSFDNIQDLISAVDRTAPDLRSLTSNDTLMGLIWSTSFAVIESGCRAGAGLGPLSTLLADLYMKVPKFSSNVGHFPNEKKVQKPLQEVYGAFIDAQLFVLLNFEQRSHSTGFDPTKDAILKKHVEETGTLLEEARGRFDLQANQAALDQERRKSEQEQPTLEAQRKLPGVLHNTPGRSTEVQFISQRRLGSGSFGEVEEVKELTTGFSYARKYIRFDHDDTEEAIEKEVKNEVQIMQKLHHQHIATVLFYLKEDSAFSIFMLPVADSDLLRFLNRCEKNEYPAELTKQIYPWFGCLLDALAYAHKLEIKHRDIKPSNILIKNHQPYLCDFGLARDFSEQIVSTSQSQKVHGSLAYRAPEAYPDNPRGRRADVFALGCVYSEMFTITQKQSLEAYRNSRYTKGSTAFRDCLPEVHKWLNQFERRGLNDLLVVQILSMMDKDEKTRPTSQKAVNYLKHERALFCVE